MATNQAEVQGNQNIVIQGVSWSRVDVTVQNLNPEEFAQKLHELHNPQKPIFILILTSTIPELQKTWQQNSSGDLDFNEVKVHYHSENRTDWKPYLQEENITKILQDFEKAWDCKLNVIFMDCADKQPTQNLIDELKLDMRQIIWIVDNFALSSSGNQNLVKHFDHIYIGGCLIPVADCCKNPAFANYAETLRQKTFPSLCNYTKNQATNFAGRIDNDLINIDLEITNTNNFFKVLSLLIRNWLQIDLKKRFNHVYSSEETTPNSTL